MSARKFRNSERVDFVIVGSGAAGGTIARELAQAGLSVVLFEQGPRLSPANFEHDELKYWFMGGITNDATRNPQTFRNDPTKKAEQVFIRPALWYARAVGGTSIHYTANYWRFREIDFIERSVIGAIPGTAFADWPLSYAELEPYYTKVEWEVGVSGLAGASPFDPPRTKPYPMPPLPVKSSGVLFERGARKLGLHPFPAPMAINSQPYRDRPACVHCGFCHGFACEVMAKASTLTSMIPEAEATGRCEVRPESYVVRIGTDKRGLVTGVNYFDRARRERFQKVCTARGDPDDRELKKRPLTRRDRGEPGPAETRQWNNSWRRCMELRQLQYFLSVADNGSLSKASAVLGIAQPALSRAVRQLEQATQTQLFYRHGRGIRLTEKSIQFQATVEPLVRNLLQAGDDLKASAGVPAGGRIIKSTARASALRSRTGQSKLRQLRSRHHRTSHDRSPRKL